MLVNCPRCGFSQPKDQYCAQCGVDMLAFKPPKQSLIKQILLSPLIQIAFVLGIAGYLGYKALHHPQNKNSSPVYSKAIRNYQVPNQMDSESTPQVPSELLEGTPPQQDSSSAASTASTLSQNSTEANSAANSLQNDSKSGDLKILGLTGDKKAKAPGSDIQNKLKPTSNIRVKVIYAEVQSRGLELLTDESRGLGSFTNFGDYSAGIVNGFTKKFTSIQKYTRILRTDAEGIEVSKSLSWNFAYKAQQPDRATPGAPDRDPASISDSQFVTQINLEEADNQNYRGSLEITKSHKESVEPNMANIQKSNYPAAFEIPIDGAFVVSGIGDHKEIGKSDTELVVFVQFEK